MIPYLKSLIWDKGAFVAMFRSGLAMFGLAIESGTFAVPEPMQPLGILAVGAALMLRSSVKPPDAPAVLGGPGK